MYSLALCFPVERSDSYISHHTPRIGEMMLLIISVLVVSSVTVDLVKAQDKNCYKMLECIGKDMMDAIIRGDIDIICMLVPDAVKCAQEAMSDCKDKQLYNEGMKQINQLEESLITCESRPQPPVPAGPPMQAPPISLLDKLKMLGYTPEPAGN